MLPHVHELFPGCGNPLRGNQRLGVCEATDSGRVVFLYILHLRIRFNVVKLVLCTSGIPLGTGGTVSLCITKGDASAVRRFAVLCPPTDLEVN